MCDGVICVKGKVKAEETFIAVIRSEDIRPWLG